MKLLGEVKLVTRRVNFIATPFVDPKHLNLKVEGLRENKDI